MTVKYLFASLAFAACVHANEGLYHTTGTVIGSDERTVTIQHGSAKWTFERGVLTEPLAVGSTVTLNYHMVADSASVTEPKVVKAPKPKAKTPAPEAKPRKTEPEAKKKTPAKPAKTPAKPNKNNE